MAAIDVLVIEVVVAVFLKPRGGLAGVGGPDAQHEGTDLLDDVLDLAETAPGQLVGDFVRGVASTQLGEVAPSYKPGVLLGDLSQALPAYAIDAIKRAAGCA